MTPEQQQAHDQLMQAIGTIPLARTAFVTACVREYGRRVEARMKVPERTSRIAIAELEALGQALSAYAEAHGWKGTETAYTDDDQRAGEIVVDYDEYRELQRMAQRLDFLVEDDPRFVRYADGQWSYEDENGLFHLGDSRWAALDKARVAADAS